MRQKHPSYLNLTKSCWENRIQKGWQMLNPCIVCPRKCKVNRLDRQGKDYGFCRVKDRAIISSYYPHFGEEKCLVGRNGSGTIFFSSCNLACVYCQNFEISQLREGSKTNETRLANMMLKLQDRNCHNINLVSPSIYIPQILKALKIAADKGLNTPIVYNTGGYDSVESLKLLEGIVDIYMPDIKYSDNKLALKYSLVPNYWNIVRRAVKEMHRQVGDLVMDDTVAKRGLLVRHLVLPNNIAGTPKIMRFLAKEISKDTYVNLMDQYYPTLKARQFKKISRRITQDEFQKAKQAAIEEGISRFDKGPL